MKKLILTSILAVLVSSGAFVRAQDSSNDYLGLPGDNLNLYAVMNLFQESQTLEEFERNLNDQNSRINNLDLNGDNRVDYITVTDYIDGNVHNIVLRTALSRNENQDIAVFTVQKFRDGSVQIQLIGDEALYGRNYIVEPVNNDYYAGTTNPGYYSRNGISINFVADWPLCRFIFYPGYVRWCSTWSWGYYPSYWNPWRPYYWDYYYGYQHNFYPEYYRHFRRWNTFRYDRYNDFYYGSIRSHSPRVSNWVRDGNYRATYSRPEMRREGEALYSRTHSERNSTLNGNNVRNNQGRRTDYSGTVTNRSAQRSESVRRSSTTVRTGQPYSGRSASRPESSGRPEASNRSGASTYSRPAASNRTGASTYSRPQASNRTSASTYNRPAASQQPVQRPEAARRAAPIASNRYSSRPEAAQRQSSNQRITPSYSNSRASRPAQAQSRSGSSSPRSQGSVARSSGNSGSRAGRSSAASSGNHESRGSSGRQGSGRR